MREALTDKRGRPLKRISLQKRVEMRRLYMAEMPRWRHPLAGYVASFLVVGLGLLVVLLEQHLLPNFYFPGIPMLLATLLVGLFWGVGPALLSVLLGALCLDYFYIPPSLQFGVLTWRGLLELLPFIVAGLVVAIITGQREAARYRAVYAEQVANEHADELARANQELEQANQLKDQFLSMASHELKTPITSIRGQAQIALRRLAKQREGSADLVTARTALEKIDEQTHRLNTLVEDLLDLSSIRSGKLRLQLRRCDLVSICRSVVEDQRLLSGRDIQLNVPSTPVDMEADCDRISQIVVNVVSNAIKYSPEASPVQVRLARADGRAIIEVQDAGPGIPKEEQANIFEPFYRSSSAQRSSKNGMGLGLAICKDIVERHSGKIWCDCQSGKGTTFFIELPLLPLSSAAVHSS